jgi:hypothetical protein
MHFSAPGPKKGEKNNEEIIIKDFVKNWLKRHSKSH